MEALKDGQPPPVRLDFLLSDASFLVERLLLLLLLLSLLKLPHHSTLQRLVRAEVYVCVCMSLYMCEREGEKKKRERERVGARSPYGGQLSQPYTNCLLSTLMLVSPTYPFRVPATLRS